MLAGACARQRSPGFPSFLKCSDIQQALVFQGLNARSRTLQSVEPEFKPQRLHLAHQG